MQPEAISKDIFWVGVNDEKTELFEGLWPIREEGISYNSYLIKDEKTALIDLCKNIYQDEYLNDLQKVVNPGEIDFLVVNHMEPDHSGALKAFREIAPQVEILTTQKAVKMLADFFCITENIRVVDDGEEIPLGIHTLQFISAPMVHWPETMMTFEKQTGTLFSCDAFGGFGKLTDGIFDDDYADISFYEQESLRYFANIVAAFSKAVLNAGAKLADLEICTIAPSHGLVWRSNPKHIISLYIKWAGYSKGTAEKGAAMLHGSMYGNTDLLSTVIEKGLRAAGIPVEVFDVTKTHVSYILPALWKFQGAVIGAPTYEGTLFPTMALVLQMAEIKRVFGKQAAYFGSYGWGGGALRFINNQFEKLKWELTDSMETAGGPTETDLEEAEKFGRRFGELIKNL